MAATVPGFNIEWYKGNKEYAELPVTVKVKGDEKKWFAPPVGE